MHAHLQKAQLVEEAPQVGDDLGTRHKLLPHRVVQYQVQISLTETCLLRGGAEREVKTHCYLHHENVTS